MVKRFLSNIYHKLSLTIRFFTAKRVLAQASALTYSTLLAFVPVVAVIFAIARGFGYTVPGLGDEGAERAAQIGQGEAEPRPAREQDVPPDGGKIVIVHVINQTSLLSRMRRGRGAFPAAWPSPR